MGMGVLDRKQFDNSRGFTLVELLVCVACISILSAVAIPEVQTHIVRTRNAKAVSNIRNAITAQEVYYTDNYTYANTITELITVGLRKNDDILMSINGAIGGMGGSFVTDTFYAFTAVHDKGQSTFNTTPGSYACYNFRSDSGTLTKATGGRGGVVCVTGD
ncbi:prepilin-type N-terminal cleavage/methylation domain-containing protein [bacterium]|nr:prepilin-type N-terminal cleavage/methylation domain-containing protein [bacterium]